MKRKRVGSSCPPYMILSQQVEKVGHQEEVIEISVDAQGAN